MAARPHARRPKTPAEPAGATSLESIVVHRVASRAVLTATTRTCTTCGASLPPGSLVRVDEWPQEVFGERVASLICAECRAVGL